MLILADDLGWNDPAKQVNDLVAEGANIVGGCCGTTPEHIAFIVTILK